MAAEEAAPVVDDGEEAELDCANSDVCTKYREAGKIANKVLEGVVQQCTVGASAKDICTFGDTVIGSLTAGIYQKKVNGVAVEKGCAFPTCISLNECLCHNSPLSSDPAVLLAEGDVVKIDLGVHIDGFIAVVAHTMVVGAEPSAETPTDGPLGNIMTASHIASEVATKMIRPGNTNQQVTSALGKVAETFGVNLCAGVLSHQMKRYVIDGNKVILLKEDQDQKVDDFVFEVNETYSVDIALSTGEGKPRPQEHRTTVFKRAVDKSYRLKMKASRYLLTQVNTNFPTLPFTLRAMEDENTARMGVVECVKHELVHPYPALYERPGDVVTHFKFTVLILPSGTARITGGAEFFNPAAYSSEVTIDEETNAILAMAGKKKKKRSKKKKADE